MYTQPRIVSIDEAVFYFKRELEKKLQRAADMLANREGTLKACLEAVGITDAEINFYFYPDSRDVRVDFTMYTLADCMSGMIDRFFTCGSFEMSETAKEDEVPEFAFGLCAFEIDGALYDVNMVYANFKTMNEFIEYVKAGKEL